MQPYVNTTAVSDVGDVGEGKDREVENGGGR